MPRTRLCQRPKVAPRPRPGSPAVLDEPMARAREHGAARPVEVAGEDVEDVDEPARRGPEALRRGADAPVDRGAGRGRQLAGHAPDPRARRYRTSPRRPRRELAGQRADSLEARDMARERAEIGELLAEERVGQREEQQRVACRGG
jgi:hypothetical protein